MILQQNPGAGGLRPGLPPGGPHLMGAGAGGAGGLRQLVPNAGGGNPGAGMMGMQPLPRTQLLHRTGGPGQDGVGLQPMTPGNRMMGGVQQSMQPGPGGKMLYSTFLFFPIS